MNAAAAKRMQVVVVQGGVKKRGQHPLKQDGNFVT